MERLTLELERWGQRLLDLIEGALLELEAGCVLLSMILHRSAAEHVRWYMGARGRGGRFITGACRWWFGMLTELTGETESG